MSAEVIAIANQKGGVGKTTVATHLAAALGHHGFKVCLIDCDANCGATQAFGIVESMLGTAEILLGEHLPEGLILMDEGPGVSLPKNVGLVPASRRLDNLQLEYDSLSDEQRKQLGNPLLLLDRSLRALEPLFDFIVLDTAPNVGTMTMNVYLAADWFIFVTEPSQLAFNGLYAAASDLRSVKEKGGAHGRLLGIVLCMVERRMRVTAQFSALANEFGAVVFDVKIHRTTKVRQAQTSGETLLSFAPRHRVAGEFRELTQEILTRIAERKNEEEEEADV